MAKEAPARVINCGSVAEYDRWLATQDVPVYRDYYVPDLRQVERGWWSLRGCPAAVLNLVGYHGRNRAGYQNPRADAVYDLLNSTIDPPARLPLLQEQAQIFTSDVVHIPLYWEPGNSIAVRGVKADIHPGNGSYRTDLWDRD